MRKKEKIKVVRKKYKMNEKMKVDCERGNGWDN